MLSTYGPVRLPRFPDAPTWVELGYNISWTGFIGFAGPKGLPHPIVDKLDSAFKQAMEDPAFKTTMDNLDMVCAYGNAEKLEEDIKDVDTLMRKFVSRLGLKKK